MHEEVGDFVVVPFSDDLAYARQLLGSIHESIAPATNTNPKHHSSAWMALGRMSSLDGIITANSSLSWWAAWLLHQSGKPCIAPRPWFGPLGPNSNNLIPKGWIEVEHNSQF
jgi:hypothetical protein